MWRARLARWADWLQSRRQVGEDLQRNKYFLEYRGQGQPEKRLVQYFDKHKQDMNALPVEWWSWLSGTRDDPPTLQELIQSQKKRENMRQKVQALEAADRKHRLEQALMNEQSRQAEPESDEAMVKSVHMLLQGTPAASGSSTAERAADAAAPNGRSHDSGSRARGPSLAGASAPKSASSSPATSSQQNQTGDFQPAAWDPSKSSRRR
ncbi:Mimitin, mitochondrial [Porphyridium purpureum]|uniref:Mimitin, mitochondrial n=1 Tax=Porphyridium purpureum TaxID=35688 RepID=A0A5J4Z2N4_PORPP|nr:Mimitin, mitochondrial [Porphyridium purpureum]|eukprot:POR5853..scf295_1